MHSSMPAFAICENPIFVIASPRSGGSAFHSALIRHPELWGSEEGGFLQPILGGVRTAWVQGNRYGKYQWLNAQNVCEAEFWKYSGMGINALYTSRAGGRTWVETTPDYSRHIFSVAALFPGARFVYLHRDGRQVVDSIRRHWGWSHLKSCRLWQECTQQVIEFKNRYPSRMATVRFERLFANPQKAFSDVFRFLKLPADTTPAQALLQQSAKTKRSAAGEPAQQPKNTRWNWLQRQWFEHACGALQGKLGYR